MKNELGSNADTFDVASSVKSAGTAGKTFVSRQIARQTASAGEQLAQTASALREAGQTMKDRGQGDFINDAAQAVADRIDGIGSYLKTSSPEELIGDLEQFGRKQPVVAGAAAFVTGFAASRLLRASASGRTPSLEK
jgi:hypothetical protein